MLYWALACAYGIGRMHQEGTCCIFPLFPSSKINNVKPGEVKMRRPQIMRNIHERGSGGVAAGRKFVCCSRLLGLIRKVKGTALTASSV